MRISQEATKFSWTLTPAGGERGLAAATVRKTTIWKVFFCFSENTQLLPLCEACWCLMLDHGGASQQALLLLKTAGDFCFEL